MRAAKRLLGLPGCLPPGEDKAEIAVSLGQGDDGPARVAALGDPRVRRLDGGGRGLVVLDRDHHSESGGFSLVEPGLEVFTWKRRHIESYALVPDAIRRSLRKALEPRLLERLLRRTQRGVAPLGCDLRNHVAFVDPVTLLNQ